jgi:hypothetical protein
MANYTDVADLSLTIGTTLRTGDTLYGGSIVTFIDPPEDDITPPTVTNFNPPDGQEIESNDAISFDVQDNLGTFTRIFVVAWFKTTGIKEVIHDGNNFSGYYSSSSSRVLISGGYRYSVQRSNGWPYAPTIEVYPIDSSGNEG